jgi:hypothetical protein
LVIANGSRPLERMTPISNISITSKKGRLDSPKLPFYSFI